MRAEGQGRLIALQRSRTVVVAGAGIGGLSVALALAAKSFRVVVLERAERLDDAGAGIQLSPNATRILIALGVGEALAPHCLVPAAIRIASARRDREIVRLPLGDSMAQRMGAPYWVVHRADLQAALLARVRASADIDLRLGRTVEDIAIHNRGVTVAHRGADGGRDEDAVALVGADGVRSQVRAFAGGAPPAEFSGYVAWRAMAAGGAPFEPDEVRLWLGRGAHLVAYPVRGGRAVNLVAIMRGAASASNRLDASLVPDRLSRLGWSGTVVAAASMAGAWTHWPLFGARTSAWGAGPVALIGDAAHAMMPFAAQGAAMAIEDAAVLADALAQTPDDIAGAVQRYAGIRRGRVARVRRLANQSGRIYRLSGPIALARNLAMRALGASRLMARQDWIYDWRQDR